MTHALNRLSFQCVEYLKGDGQMIRSGLIIMIKDLAEKGKSAGGISREFGVTENTARRYISQPVRPHGLKGRKKPSKLS